MTFEEFFKKKKINLVLLKSAEPDLFAEFESHYHLMGEKSFDHTKKYWFNLLRRKYHPPDEPKVEKVIIENKIAEQTITEAIIEAAEAPTPKLGFKPKFKTGAVTNLPEENIPAKITEKSAEELTAETPAPKLGFKPKFKTASAPAKNITEAPEKISAPVEETGTPAPKLGFKPKFKPASAPVENIPLIPEDQADPEVKPGG